jgi:hypothetical protein
VRVRRTAGFGDLKKGHVVIVPALRGAHRRRAQSARRTSGL